MVREAWNTGRLTSMYDCVIIALREKGGNMYVSKTVVYENDAGISTVIRGNESHILVRMYPDEDKERIIINLYRDVPDRFGNEQGIGRTLYSATIKNGREYT